MAHGDWQRDPVEALADDFLARLRRGEHPPVEDYAARHPDLADEIREVFPTVAQMEELKRRREAARGETALAVAAPERLGDFRIVRQIGRGGMGVVYEAVQESLGRPVAIKVLAPAACLPALPLERFRREAQTAASLHHSNIVPVLGVGQSEGCHYIVMQLIRGEGLDAILARGRAPAASVPGGSCWQLAARVGLQAAEALSYAHRRGILHRDVKPANLILDADGAVWVTDFGLAKALGETSMTRSGDVCGTLRYMAPERLHGQGDARSDLYGLGLTLYEMIALRPAFDEPDPGILMRRISQEGPPRLRQRCPSVPRDLETIILKATAREPAHRYATAAALAEDLRAFLEDRPIRARRVSALEHTWRWCRRNRTVAGLATAAAALVVLVALVAGAGYVRTERANLRARAALAGQWLQRQRAEATAAVAMETLDRIFDQYVPRRMTELATVAVDDASGIRVPVEPVVSPETASLLERMLASYRRLAEQGGASAELRRKAAAAQARVGEIHARLSRFEPARRAYHRAVECYRELEAGARPEAEVNLCVAQTQNALGNLMLAAGRVEEAARYHRLALAELAKAALPSSPSAPVRYETARTCYFLGRAAPPEAIPTTSRRGTDLGSATGRDAKALLRAVGLLRELVQQHPGVPDYRHLLACCYRELPPDAEAEGESRPLDAAVEILEKLVADFPQAPDYRYDLAKTYAQIDFRSPGLRGGRFQGARERLEEAARMAEDLAARHPDVTDYKAFVARVQFLLGDVLRYGQQPEAGEAAVRKALAIQSSLSERFPEAVPYKLWTAILQDCLARMLSEPAGWDEALALAQQSAATLEAVRQAVPEARYMGGLLARSYQGLAGVHRRRGEADKAAEAARRSLRWREAGP